MFGRRHSALGSMLKEKFDVSLLSAVEQEVKVRVGRL
jgi:hypothetical protein